MSDKKFSNIFKKGWNKIFGKEEDMTKLRTKSLYRAREGIQNVGTPHDRGLHVVCALLTEEFLAFSKSRGNDLSTPRPEFNFPGLKDGDSWCLCVERWKEAYEFGFAPKIYLKRTNKKALKVVGIDILKEFAIDLS